MAASQSLHVGMQINDLTECAICTETLSEPKLIPCFHTFCLKCLEKLCQGNGSKKSLPCPLCRTEFIIPVGGMSKLRTNFFVEKLKEAGNCLKSMIPSKNDQCNCQPGQKPVIYCHDCKMVACNTCEREHHQKHNSENFKVFAANSNQQIADDVSKVKNMLENINSRKIDVEKDVSMLVINFKETKAKIESRSTYLKQQIENQTQSLLGELALLESIEIEKADKMKQQHEVITNEIRNILQFSECSNDDNFASMGLIQVAEELHSRIKELDIQFKKFEEKRSEGLSKVLFEESDNNNAVGEISMQGGKPIQEKLLGDESKTIATKQSTSTRKPPPKNLMDIDPVPKSPAPAPTHVPRSRLHQASVQNMTTQPQPYPPMVQPILQTPPGYSPFPPYLLAPQQFKSRPKKLQMIEPYYSYISASFDEENKIKKTNITGIVALGRNLYITTTDSDEVDVYDCSNLAYVESFTVDPLEDPYDITGYGSLLYISERNKALIHKFRLAQKNASTWQVHGECMNLSVTSLQNVLATCCEAGSRFIAEYSRYGDLVRRIELNRSITNPTHAICLNNGNLVVCHGEAGNKLRRVCLIDSGGNVINSFGGAWGNNFGYLNEPCRLASYDDNLILVADSRNGNVQILNGNLECVGVLIAKVHLRSISVNAQTNQIFVLQYNEPNSKILSFNIANIHAYNV